MDNLVSGPKLFILPHHTISYCTFQHGAGFKIIGPFCHLLFSGNSKCWSDSVAKQEFKIVREVARRKELGHPDYDQWSFSVMGSGHKPLENVGNSEQLERE